MTDLEALATLAAAADLIRNERDWLSWAKGSDVPDAYIAAASPDVVLELVRVALAADALRLVYAGVNVKSKLLSELFGAVDALGLDR